MRAGQPVSPIKVTITRTGDLDPAAQFFSAGDVPKLVYTASHAVAGLAGALGNVATIIDAGEPPTLGWLLADLFDRGVRRLMVEGCSQTHTQFLAAAL